MRQSLSSSAVELVNCVTKMTEDGKRTVEQLRAQISVYEGRVEAAERLASVDPLTGVSNRRILERQLERRTAEGAPFFVIYLDLNDFKQINDTLGHLAGDDLLKQFAGELRHSMRSTDLVARLGGDEFVAVVEGAAGDVQERIGNVKKRVNGDYSLVTDSGKRKLPIAAAVGIAVWKASITAQELLPAADRAMYEDKKRMSVAKNPAPVIARARRDSPRTGWSILGTCTPIGKRRTFGRVGNPPQDGQRPSTIPRQPTPLQTQGRINDSMRRAGACRVRTPRKTRLPNIVKAFT